MKILRSVGWLVLVFAVGVGGVLVGTKLRDKTSTPAAEALPPELALPKLPFAEPFPDVALADASGHAVQTRDLLGQQGGVVLFIDLECSPCTAVVQRWQTALDHGDIQPGQVWGVCYYPRAMIADYADEHHVTIPIYSDTLQVFRSDFGIEHFPLAVTVGGSGLVRRRSYDSVSAIDFGELARDLER